MRVCMPHLPLLVPPPPSNSPCSLYTVVIAGFVTSLLGGSSVAIGGPTAAFIPIVVSALLRPAVWWYVAGDAPNTHSSRASSPSLPSSEGRTEPMMHRHIMAAAQMTTCVTWPSANGSACTHAPGADL